MMLYHCDDMEEYDWERLDPSEMVRRYTNAPASLTQTFLPAAATLNMSPRQCMHACFLQSMLIPMCMPVQYRSLPPWPWWLCWLQVADTCQRNACHAMLPLGCVLQQMATGKLHSRHMISMLRTGAEDSCGGHDCGRGQDCWAGAGGLQSLQMIALGRMYAPDSLQGSESYIHGSSRLPPRSAGC